MYFNGCSSSGNISKTFIIEPLSTTGGTPVLSACTAVYTNQIISCSGDTIISLSSGYTEFNNNIIVNGDISGTTLYSGSTNLYDVILSAISQNDVYVTGGTFSGSTLLLTRNDGQNIFSTFTGNTSGDCITDLYVSNIFGCSPITIHDDLIPVTDNVINLGTPLKRYRNINTVSGTTSYWSATTIVHTPILHLGLDLSGNTRQITADNSIIQNDCLLGGTY